MESDLSWASAFLLVLIFNSPKTTSMSVIPFIYILMGLFALIAQMVYFLLESATPASSANKIKYKRYWHWAGGAIHIWGAVLVGNLFGWRYGLLMGSLMWFFFDGFVNSYALNREWFYIGITAITDIAQQFLSKVFHIDPRTLSGILKSLLLAVSIWFLLKPLL